SGKVRWKKNIAEEIGAELPEWGFAGSPLVYGELLILNVGTHGTAV
ncbi:MAG TPA: alcohol dehydrogenase, partial [Verrucomicrobiales bacterium]|nr:alcohol dehydrogenase [Verrucomicrobiales bacterium]